MVKRFDPKQQAKGLAKKILEAQPSESILEIPVKLIINDPNQPRKRFDKDKLEQLAASIRATRQELPIIVRPMNDASSPYQYIIVHGERRWRAVQLNGQKTVQGVVRPYTEEDIRDIVNAQAAENGQREGLTLKEQVDEAQRLIAVNGGLAEAAEATGRPKTKLSKLSNIGKAGELFLTVLDKGLCDDIETMYRLVRASRKDQSAAERVLNRWLAAPDRMGNQRQQVDQLLARLEPTDDDDKQAVPPPSGKPASTQASEAAAPASPEASPKNGPGAGAGVNPAGSSATHESASSPAARVSPVASVGGIASQPPSRPVSQAQRDVKSGESGSASPVADGPVLRCLSANFETDTVLIRTDSGDLRFDRKTLADVLGMAG